MTPDTKPPTEDIELERTGRAPLRFRGHVLTTACGQFVQTAKDKPNSDYFTVTVYVVDDNAKGTISANVVQIVYTKEFRGTQQHHTVIVGYKPASILTEFNPLSVLIGFPPHENYAERQLMLETKCRRQYDLLASAVLKMFPEEIGDQLPDQRAPFSYPAFKDFERTLTPTDEQRIRDVFQAVLDGNDCFDDRSKPEMEESLWLFRHGWICARLSREG